MEPAIIPSLAHLAARAAAVQHGSRIRLRSYTRTLTDEAIDLIREEDRDPAREFSSNPRSERIFTVIYHWKTHSALFETSFSKSAFGSDRPWYATTVADKHYLITQIDTRWRDESKGLIARRERRQLISIEYKCPECRELIVLHSANAYRDQSHWHGPQLVGTYFRDWRENPFME